ncbi:MAG TPA: cytochrome P450 [Steroidobacteraceae bacterium]|jgi:hypothetical protein|nr:cytochrome P450 [Steroidobacteraceae bacterium]
MSAISQIGFADLLQPQVLADPYPLFRRLRQEDPVHADPSGRGWMVTRHQEAQIALSDRRLSARRILTTQRQHDVSEAVSSALSLQMLFMDPPDHTRLRALFSKAFVPSRMEALRSDVAAMVERLFDAADAHGGQIDFVRDFAVPLPVAVIARLLGVPASDHGLMLDWSHALGLLIGGRELNAQEASSAQQGILAFVAYFRELIERRRSTPADDMLSRLIVVEELGDRLSTQELIVNLMLLLAAGHSTTSHLLSSGLLALSRHPDQWQLLVDDPRLATSAVNELLRFDGPVQATARQATCDLVLSDRTVRCGELVTVFLGSANRDEAHFDAPDRLDLRRPTARALSFGHGIHTCLGAALARMEVQVVLEALARRYPGFAVDADSVAHLPSVAFRGLLTLRVELRK